MTPEQKAQVDAVYAQVTTFTKDQSDYLTSLFMALAEKVGKAETAEKFVKELNE